jgi:hypothetical protein
MLNPIAFISKFYLELSVSSLLSFCGPSNYISPFVSLSFIFVFRSNISVSVPKTKKHRQIKLKFAVMRPILVLFLKVKYIYFRTIIAVMQLVEAPGY